MSPEESARLDDELIGKILGKDIQSVYDLVTELDISACGFGPIMALMAYSRRVDPACRMGVLRRGHSGEVSPSPKVVNYACILSELSAAT